MTKPRTDPIAAARARPRISDNEILQIGRSARDGTATDAITRALCIRALGLGADRDDWVRAARDRLADGPAASLEWARQHGVVETPAVRTHDVDAGGWLDSFIGDASLAMRARPGITYVEYMRTRLERDPSDLDGVDHERDRDRSARVPELFEHDAGIIVLSEVVSVCARVLRPIALEFHEASNGLTDCLVLLRSGASLSINAKHSAALAAAVKAYHGAGVGVVTSEITSGEGGLKQ
jgi:hypothetical protein